VTVQIHEGALQVVAIESGTVAAASDLKAGDVITNINRRAVSDLSGFASAMGGRDAAQLQVRREGETVTVDLSA